MKGTGERCSPATDICEAALTGDVAVEHMPEGALLFAALFPLGAVLALVVPLVAVVLFAQWFSGGRE